MLSNGNSNGFTGSIPIGGHWAPNSTVGVNALWKKAQNIAKTLDFELSAPIFYRGIKELVEKKIIAKSVDKIVFYINPAIFFNGDRARFVTEVIKKKEEIEKNQLLQELEDTSKNKDFDVNETDDSVENLDLMIARLQKKKEELERKEKFGQWQDLEDAS